MMLLTTQKSERRARRPRVAREVAVVVEVEQPAQVRDRDGGKIEVVETVWGSPARFTHPFGALL